MIFKRLTAVILSAALLHVAQPVVMAEPLADSPAPATPPPSSPLKEPLIEVSVDSLEISENNTKDVGIRWLLDPNSGEPTLNFAEGVIPGIFKIGELERITPITARLKMLVQNGQARILANPTLVTKSSFEATFSVGGEIPYPTVGQGGVGGVEFKKYGVLLKILPTITPRRTIDAQINMTVSNPDESNSKTIQGVVVPAIASRDAGSKVEVTDGETVVLAGIKQSRREKTVYKVPVLGSIPLLGMLFRSTREITTQNSLVIFVTFRLLKQQ